MDKTDKQILHPLTMQIPVDVQSPQQRHLLLPTGRRRLCLRRLCVVSANQTFAETPPHS